MVSWLDLTAIWNYKQEKGKTDEHEKEQEWENNLTGRPSLIIPDFASVMLWREPPKAAKCSFPIVVMTDAASSLFRMTFVASLAPPRPA